MTKEKVLRVACDVVPDIRVRTILSTDSPELTKEKKKVPFKLCNNCTFTITTSDRVLQFTIEAPYDWNSADLPRPLWWLGSSRDNDYVVASMVHDYLLQYKVKIYKEVFHENITASEFRRLTSLIFREILKEHKMNVVKANVEAWFVDFFQGTFNKKNWKDIPEKKDKDSFTKL